MSLAHQNYLLVAAMLFSGVHAAWAAESLAPPVGSGSMPGMDHSQMNSAAMSGMDKGMGGGAMSMQGGKAPPDARDPRAYSDGEDFGPIPPPRMGDAEARGALMVDRFEAVHADGDTTAVYDLQASYGRDYNRTVLKAEGEIDDGRLADARTELLWGHSIATYWDTQLGVRFDSGAGADRRWLAFGVQGLAPYWFDVEATAYAGEQGRTAVKLMTEYELLLTQRLILQPRLETTFYGKRDVENELGSGWSDLSAGVRLRYEIRREFAPYVGVEWAGKFGDTADYARAAGMDSNETRLIAGVRFWY